jgi:N,N'-diacetyllegionaminate synthase
MTSQGVPSVWCGRGEGPYLIAEVAQAHEGSLGTAHAFIDIAASAGADAVKFQTHIAAAESTFEEPWRVKFSEQDATRYAYWERMEFSAVEWRGLAEHARACGIDFISSPFSVEAIDLLESLDVPFWKVASGEVCNRLLLERIWKTGKPVVFSTGMSTFAEIDGVLEEGRSRGCEVAVMQCSTSYPTAPSDWGLGMIRELSDRYGVPVGFSDHSGSIYAGLAATALGARLLEVHLTLSRKAFGPDVPASLTPEEFGHLVAGSRAIGTSLRSGFDKDDFAARAENVRRVFSRSVALRDDLPSGTTLERGHLTLKKPGTGIPPDELDALVGRRLKVDKNANRLLTLEDLE